MKKLILVSSACLIGYLLAKIALYGILWAASLFIGNDVSTETAFQLAIVLYLIYISLIILLPVVFYRIFRRVFLSEQKT